jgi:hypothetical protein
MFPLRSQAFSAASPRALFRISVQSKEFSRSICSASVTYPRKNSPQFAFGIPSTTETISRNLSCRPTAHPQGMFRSPFT